VVYDLDRLTYSADLRVKVPVTGLRVAGMVGGGRVDDDYDDDGRVDLRFVGWDVRLIWSLGEAFGSSLSGSFGREHDVQLTGRYDWYQSEWNGVGDEVEQKEITLGVNYLYRSFVRVMLDAILRRTDEPGMPDLADDGLLLSFQIAI